MKKYIYLGKDLQVESYLLRHGMVISENDLTKLKKSNKKITILFYLTTDYPKIKAQLRDENSFYSRKIEKAFKEVLNAV
ncbi:hypothetical protein [uncultured Cetobacterium sp.]|uniref:hypothetical protein n=1 Tax=uncultured Cetobacterium sp. TaxID=527638 RepID=UPI0026267EB0|nr:hypothetical protein [uncultured Cetobacterium sp.]